jgi:hypothetical protein
VVAGPDSLRPAGGAAARGAPETAGDDPGPAILNNPARLSGQPAGTARRRHFATETFVNFTGSFGAPSPAGFEPFAATLSTTPRPLLTEPNTV